MLFFNCCIACDGDLLMEATRDQVTLRCLRCDYSSAVPANTHLFEVLCNDAKLSFAPQAA